LHRRERGRKKKSGGEKCRSLSTFPYGLHPEREKEKARERKRGEGRRTAGLVYFGHRRGKRKCKKERRVELTLRPAGFEGKKRVEKKKKKGKEKQAERTYTEAVNCRSLASGKGGKRKKRGGRGKEKNCPFPLVIAGILIFALGKEEAGKVEHEGERGRGGGVVEGIRPPPPTARPTVRKKEKREKTSEK